jgi:receptor protein-tyrosine kinase
VEFRDLVAIVWKRRYVVLAVLVACIALSAVLAGLQSARYESTATIAFTPDTDEGQDFIPSDNLSALLSTYAEVAKSEQNLARARAILGGPIPGEVATSTQGGSGILEIIGKDTSPAGARDTARATAQAFVESIEGNGIIVPSVINPAVEPSTPLQPRPPLIISMAAVLGLIAGVLLALALESFRRGVDGPGDLAHVTALPVIGRLRRHRALHRSAEPLVWSSPKMVDLQEAYRALRTNLELLLETQSTTLQVTSADAGNGKSTVVANLGVALGQLGIPTVIVDADLRRPRQHEIFGLDNEVGLSTLMMMPSSDVAPQATEYQKLWVLPSGPLPQDPTEMLHVRFRTALRRIASTGGFVLVDSPPVLPVSDARLIAPQVDNVLFVVSAGQRTSAVAAALERLRFADVDPIGIVLNLDEHGDEAAGGYGYGAYRLDPETSPPPVGVG